MEHINLVKRLRTRLPVGIKEAADLLQSTGGDINRAQQIWTNQLAGKLVEQTGITPAEAKALLEKRRYDFESALLDWRRANVPLVQLILAQRTDPYTKLERIYYALKESGNLSGAAQKFVRMFEFDKEAGYKLYYAMYDEERVPEMIAIFREDMKLPQVAQLIAFVYYCEKEDRDNLSLEDIDRYEDRDQIYSGYREAIWQAMLHYMTTHPFPFYHARTLQYPHPTNAF